MNSINFLKSELIIKEKVDKTLEIREKYNLEDVDEFNIFTTISESYKKEIFHSYILYTILNPTTKKVRNIEYLNLFVKEIINKSGKNFKFELFKDNVKVSREHKNIDIFISDETKAIIIENKINNAPDQENQLARYYETVIEEENIDKENIVIIYLPLTKDKTPNFDYTGEYKKYEAEIKDRLITLPAIGLKGENTLLNNFLDKCLEITKNDLMKVYIDQYIDLIKKIGKDVVLMGTQKELLEEILKEKEIKNRAKEISEVWENREELIFELLRDFLISHRYEYISEENEETIVKKIEKDKTAIGIDSTFSVGFFKLPYDGSAGFQNRSKLIEILEGNYFKSNYWEELDTYNKNGKKDYVSKTLKYDSFDTLDTLQTHLKDTLDFIEKEFNKI